MRRDTARWVGLAVATPPGQLGWHSASSSTWCSPSASSGSTAGKSAVKYCTNVLVFINYDIDTEQYCTVLYCTVLYNISMILKSASFATTAFGKWGLFVVNIILNHFSNILGTVAAARDASSQESVLICFTVYSRVQ